jgi:hypothetical protein
MVECCSFCHVNVCGKSRVWERSQYSRKEKLLKFIYFVKIRGDEFAVLSQEPIPVLIETPGFTAFTVQSLLQISYIKMYLHKLVRNDWL